MENAQQNWKTMMDVWKSGQVGLPKVRRWSKYVDDAKHGGARLQNSLEHSYCIVILGGIVCAKLRRYSVIDERLVMLALHVHDHGEGEIGMDTLYVDKSIEGDLQEYTAFRKRYDQLEPYIFRDFHRAFLLQFALKNTDPFPPDARELMGELANIHRLEALAFQAIEYLDYLVFALEQFEERGNRKILVQVLRNTVPHLDRLAEDLVGFRAEIWTPVMREWCAGWLMEYQDQWIEQKGEK